jgi:Ser/Thr protein kinase RdoA (MazF antagonist)
METVIDQRLPDRNAQTKGEDAGIGGVATEACRRALSVTREPRQVQILKHTARSAVVRLVGAGAGGQTIIAKRSNPAAVRLESTVYTEILPQLRLPYVRYCGMLEGPNEAWLFVEDAGGRQCSLTEQPVAVAHWLARLHAGASSLALADRLPSRSVDHYREHLEAACALIAGNREQRWLTAEDRRVLDELLAGLQAVARDWPELIARANALPATLVHGDLKPRNIRLRTCDGQSSVLVFDWEQCGWGTAASDLGALGFHFGLSQYWAALTGRWAGLEARELIHAARLGRLFRVLAGIHWAAMHLTYPWDADRQAMRRSDLRLRFYLRELASVMALIYSQTIRRPRAESVDGR